MFRTPKAKIFDSWINIENVGLSDIHNIVLELQQENAHTHKCVCKIARVDARHFTSLQRCENSARRRAPFFNQLSTNPVHTTFSPTHLTPTINNNRKKDGEEKKKRPSGKSKNRPKGVERRPLLLKSEFTPACMGQLATHGFNPPEQRFLPDGRWTCETRANGKFVKWTHFHSSFDWFSKFFFQGKCRGF